MPLPRRPLALAAALALPAGARAQTVAGRVLDGATGAPLPNAVVVLLDSAR